MALEFKIFGNRETRDINAFNPDLEYNEQLLRSQPWRHDRTKHTSDYFFAEDLSELNCLLDGLVHEGSIPAAVCKLHPEDYNLGPGASVPDFRVVLTTGETIFVEITSGGEPLTIREHETLNELSHALRSWSLANLDVQRKLNGLELAFIPLHTFKGKDEKVALGEMKAFVLAEDPQPYKSAPGTVVNSKQYPVLTRSECTVLVADSVAPVAEVRAPGSSWSPDGDVDTILKRINSKIVNRYDGFRPIRLVVGSFYVIGHRGDTFNAIRSRLNWLGPFERVYIADSGAALVAYRSRNAIPEIDDMRDVRQQVIADWRIERHHDGPLMLIHDPSDTHERRLFRLDPSREDYGLDFNGEAMSELMSTLSRERFDGGQLSPIRLCDEIRGLLDQALRAIREQG